MQKLKSTIKLEVERKFAGFTYGSPTLRQGTPPFLKLRDMGERTFHDLYFDDADLLSNNGFWLRQRDGNWQMKFGTTGDRLNSRLQETSDLATIKQKIQRLTGRNSAAPDNFGLYQLASFRTIRSSWLADDEFTLVLDRTDFGHTVGEVELEVNAEVVNDDEAEKIMAEMDLRIVGFLKRYKDSFSDEVPVGKLSSYLARTNRLVK